MDLMIHDIDIVLGLVDSPPVRLAAQGAAVHSSVTDVASVQIRFESGTIATITASRATEEKVRTLAITMPDAYVHLDYTDQDIRIYRRANQQYTMSRKAIRLLARLPRRASPGAPREPLEARDPAPESPRTAGARRGRRWS